jgi:hypothetical protein
MKVTSCGGLDVELSHIREAGKKDQVPFPPIQPIFNIRGNVPPFKELIGQD